MERSEPQNVVRKPEPITVSLDCLRLEILGSMQMLDVFSVSSRLVRLVTRTYMAVSDLFTICNHNNHPPSLDINICCFFPAPGEAVNNSFLWIIVHFLSTSCPLRRRLLSARLLFLQQYHPEPCDSFRNKPGALSYLLLFSTARTCVRGYCCFEFWTSVHRLRLDANTVQYWCCYVPP